MRAALFLAAGAAGAWLAWAAAAPLSEWGPGGGRPLLAALLLALLLALLERTANLFSTKDTTNDGGH